jgi:protein-L-isoaspartate(D-aspartate) O-methyltransferase
MVAQQLERRDISDAEVLGAMRAVPRHEFVPEAQVRYAYEDRPLPIGEGQTISQPYIVALMTQVIDIQPGDRVLEVGTGSGFQAAVLAELTDEVYTVEIIEVLAQRAAGVLSELGYAHIHGRIGDGYYGWEEYAPYDAIVVTCAPDHIPHSLTAQLKVGGKMVIPVGPPGAYQSLWLLEKGPDGEVHSRNLGAVGFVPMTGDH